MYKTANHYYGGGIRIFISLWICLLKSPTNVQKAGEGISVPRRAPYLHLGRGRDMTVFVVSEHLVLGAP